MMSLNLRNALIIDSHSPFHRKEVSIHIEKGVISKISNDLPKAKKELDLKGAIVTPGFIDLSCFLGDPGAEHKEDIESGLAAAKDGGFCHVCVQPDTIPVIDSKSGIEYLLSKGRNHIVELMPYGSVSVGNKNESLSELLDLHQHGAVAFSGGADPIGNAELLQNALRYASRFDGVIINRPMDEDLSKFGQMHEGSVSTYLGLKGIPEIAEIIMVERDLRILEYAGGRLHLSGISSAQSLTLIEKAKKSGLQVTCDVPVHNLLLNDERLSTYDSNAKLNPPLRSESNRTALLKGVKKGIVDAITSDHQPHDVESKKLEFDYASFGMIGLQTLVPNIVQLSANLEMEVLLDKLSAGPRRILGLPPRTIDVDQAADITLIDPSFEWEFNDQTSLSKSRNSIYFGNRMVGRSIGIINGEKTYFSRAVK